MQTMILLGRILPYLFMLWAELVHPGAHPHAPHPHPRKHRKETRRG